MRKKAIFADIICLHSNTEPKHDVHVDNTRGIGTTFQKGLWDQIQIQAESLMYAIYIYEKRENYWGVQGESLDIVLFGKWK